MWIDASQSRYRITLMVKDHHSPHPNACLLGCVESDCHQNLLYASLSVDQTNSLQVSSKILTKNFESKNSSKILTKSFKPKTHESRLQKPLSLKIYYTLKINKLER